MVNSNDDNGNWADDPATVADVGGCKKEDRVTVFMLAISQCMRHAAKAGQDWAWS